VSRFEKRSTSASKRRRISSTEDFEGFMVGQALAVGSCGVGSCGVGS
jgi:hypothetical protein